MKRSFGLLRRRNTGGTGRAVRRRCIRTRHTNRIMFTCCRTRIGIAEEKNSKQDQDQVQDQAGSGAAEEEERSAGGQEQDQQELGRLVAAVPGRRRSARAEAERTGGASAGRLARTGLGLGLEDRPILVGLAGRQPGRSAGAEEPPEEARPAPERRPRPARLSGVRVSLGRPAAACARVRPAAGVGRRLAPARRPRGLCLAGRRTAQQHRCSGGSPLRGQEPEDHAAWRRLAGRGPGRPARRPGVLAQPAACPGRLALLRLKCKPRWRNGRRARFRCVCRERGMQVRVCSGDHGEIAQLEHNLAKVRRPREFESRFPSFFVVFPL